MNCGGPRHNIYLKNMSMKYITKQPTDLNAELLSCSSFLLVIVDLNLAESGKMTECKLLSDQMELKTSEKFITHYQPHTMRDATNLYLGSPKANKAIRNLLMFPHNKTIKICLGELVV